MEWSVCRGQGQRKRLNHHTNWDEACVGDKDGASAHITHTYWGEACVGTQDSAGVQPHVRNEVKRV